MEKTIAIFIRDLDGGGAQRVVINLLQGMIEQGIIPDLILSSVTGSFLNQVPPEVRIINLNSKTVMASIPALTKYLIQVKPKALISHLHSNNVASIISRDLARVSTRLLLVSHTNFSLEKLSLPKKAKLLPTLMKFLYRRSATLIAVSQGAARNLEDELNFKKNVVKTLYNPVISKNIFDKANEHVEHPWLQPKQPPVFLTVGRLIKDKDHKNLIKAFAYLRSKHIAKLIILGEGDFQNELKALTKELGVETDVDIPGFVSNPYAYMSKASGFVLTSLHEALPTVLIEAMACGCSIISTDCPYGPREILDNGKYGLLIPLQDPVKLAEAMEYILDNPVDKAILLKRAHEFSIESIVNQYLKLINCH